MVTLSPPPIRPWTFKINILYNIRDKICNSPCPKISKNEVLTPPIKNDDGALERFVCNQRKSLTLIIEDIQKFKCIIHTPSPQ